VRDIKPLLLKLLMAAAAPLAVGSAAPGQPVLLTIESWRHGDLAVWRDQLIPAFEKAHPGIKVVFSPTPPADYDKALESKLEKGSAGDLIACRPFDASLRLFRQGRLLRVDGLRGMSNFTPLSRLAWSSDDRSQTFCVPVASVVHGFVYNTDALRPLRLAPPNTWDEFEAVLKRLKADGRFIPLLMGTQDPGEAAIGYQNIGPNFHRGEAGRNALLAGAEKLTDPRWVEPWRAIARWRPYLGKGFEAQSHRDGQTLFLLGMGAIYPVGSWELVELEKRATFMLGAFKPPLRRKGDPCHVLDHPDIALGVNAKSPHPRQAKVFLEWVASAEFAELHSNALPGFFSLSGARVDLRSPLARQFLAWRGQCASTIRWTQHLLSRGRPNLEDALGRTGAEVVEGTLSPEEAAAQLQGFIVQPPQRKPR
jgi:raffinose/stachyose/melibiose transport system substrate-binding protein